MMQSYKYKDLYNTLVQQKASEAFEAQHINAGTYKSIFALHWDYLQLLQFSFLVCLSGLYQMQQVTMLLLFCLRFYVLLVIQRWSCSSAQNSIIMPALIMY